MKDNKSIEKNIKRSTNNFNFTDTIGDFVINDKFKKGLQDLKAGYKTKDTYIWEVLSSMNGDVSETIYENILHYIENIANVDTCKISSLKSMMKSIGIEYSIFNNIEKIPLEIQKLMDILSVNKRYLYKNNFLKVAFKNELYKNVTVSSDIELNVPCDTISDEQYENYIKTIYYNFLSGIVNLKYADKENSIDYQNCIWYGLKDELIDKSSTVKISKFIEFKTQNNITNLFNEEKIVDNIDIGEDNINNYVGVEKELLLKEIEYRAQPISLNRPQTKYNYYREKKVKEYFEFIEWKCNSKDLFDNIQSVGYDIDNNFLELKTLNNEQENNEKLIITNPNSSIGYEINNKMINDVVDNLATMTLLIQTIRSKIKIEVQKNYMKGTYNLLKYIINEYLISLSNSKIFKESEKEVIKEIKNRLRDIKGEDINIIDYYDTTEYYNIDTNTINDKNLNEKYWEYDSLDYITNSAFEKSQINEFYNNTLNCKNKVDKIENFLSTLYNYGASKTHIENDKIVYQNSSQQQAEYHILMSYGGQDFTYYPYYNHKNTTHPSFQIHPYLNNFITDFGYRYPVENTFYNDAIYNLEDMLISNLIGNYGQVIDVAMNNQYDFSGYKTKYEQSPHTEKGYISKIVDYEGAFYPAAVVDLINDRQNFINSIKNKEITDNKSSYYEKYYAHLGLTDEECIIIANKLDTYITMINDIVSYKNNKSDVYDIYKYATDINDNTYILYKKYDSENPTFKEKQNTTGQLWVRIKNHPIAFPAFYGNSPAIDVDKKYLNGNITLLSKYDIENTHEYEHNTMIDKNQMQYFYDFEIDFTRRTILLVANPLNNEINHNVTELLNPEYHKYEFGEIIICNIEQIYDTHEKCTKIRLTSDKIQHLTHIQLLNSEPIDKQEWVDDTKNVKCILGIFPNEYSINILYIEKLITKIDNKFKQQFDNSYKLDFSLCEYYPNVSFKQQNISLKLDTKTFQNKYQLVDDNIKFSYNDGLYTFAFLVNKFSDNVDYKTYLGMGDDKIQVKKSILTHKDNIYNSFDHLDKYIYIVDAYLINDFSIASDNLYNLNVDASYLPQFAGEDGFHDYCKNIFTNNMSHKSIELLGESTNLLRDIEDSILKDDMFSLKRLESLNEFICGRIYEDYDNDKHLFNSFIIQKMPWRGSSIGDNSKYWEVIIPNEIQEHINSFYIVIGNKFTSSKNLYFAGNITELSSDNEDIFNSGFISLSEKYHSYANFAPTSEIQDIQNEFITAAGTYNNINNELNNKLDTNYLYGVKDIQIKFEGTTNRLMFKFITDKQWLIQDGELYVALFNPSELRMYEWYHLMEPVNINTLSLSNIELSNYTSLSDIYCLKGIDSLAFKNSEQDIFEPDDIRFYFPGTNTKYPIRACDIFESMKNKLDVADYRNKYLTQSNTYMLKMNDMEQLNDIGMVNIPYQLVDDNTLIVYEDYLKTDSDGQKNKYKYDTSSTKILNFTNVTECELKELEEPLNNFINSCSFNSYLSSTVNDIYVNYGSEPLYTENGNNTFTTDYIEYIPQLSNLNGIEKFNNIYVQYDKDNSGITLYFNYMNFYNSPFMKIENGEQTSDIINGSYLKLLPNEDGILDIILQIRYHLNDRTLIGISNLKIASYRIFNVSDDKPKFLIQKTTENIQVISNIKTEKYKTIINIENKVVDIDDTNREINQQFSLNCFINSNCGIGQCYYSFSYPKEILDVQIPTQYQKYITENQGIITISSPESVYINFQTKQTIGQLINSQQGTFIFTIMDSEFYTNNNYEVECEYNHGLVKCQYTQYLRQQSENRDDLILLQQSEKIIIKE